MSGGTHDIFCDAVDGPEKLADGRFTRDAAATGGAIHGVVENFVEAEPHPRYRLTLLLAEVFGCSSTLEDVDYSAPD